MKLTADLLFQHLSFTAQRETSTLNNPPTLGTIFVETAPTRVRSSARRQHGKAASTKRTMCAWWVGASERRVDGDRVTELVRAKDWLAAHGDNRGPEVNPLVTPEVGPDMPPALPKYLSRDHLHDRNRINALYDPAQPGMETYVRVTRRRAPPETPEGTQP